jgi:flagellar biosynthesis protein FlhB
MSDADKPFSATPNRIARARREGSRPRSNELCGIAAFGGALAAAAFSIPLTFAQAGGAVTAAAEGRSLVRPLPQLLPVLAGALIPLTCAAVAALVAGTCDGGLRLAAVTVDAKRLDAVSGLRRMFSREALLTAGRAAAAFVAALLVLAAHARETLTSAIDRRPPAALLGLSATLALRACIAILVVGSVFAVLERWSAHRRWLEGLRMTHDELKRDVREAEGDPHAKGRRASLHRALVRGAIARVREASFVVTNPAHIAIALKYAPPEIAVPEILVRACDEGAQRVKVIAREHGIPVVEDVALARALFAEADAGEVIPRALYVAVAQIVAALVNRGLIR